MRGIFPLLRLFTLRELLSSRGRPLLTLFGIALGVSVYLAIRLANSHTLASFATTLDAVAGKATLQVSAGGLGFDEMLFLKVKGTSGVLHAAPVVQATALLKGREGDALLVLGVDTFSEEFFREYDFKASEEGKLTLSLLSEPDTIFITERMARGQGIKTGDRLVLLTGAKARAFRVRGMLRERGAALAFGGNLAVMDIAAAQEAFDKVGRLDRIDIIQAQGVRLEALRERLKALLPPHLTVERPVRRNAQVDKMLSSFRLNLTVLSFIALLVGLFLVHNTMSAAVVRRRREIGILRSLGVTSKEVLLLFTLEAGLVGLAGSALGVLLGYLFARGALETVSTTVSLLYAYTVPISVAPSPALVAAALGLGTLAALIAGLIPAREAARVPPRESMAEGSISPRAGERLKGLSFAGGALLLTSALLSQGDPIGGIPLMGYLSALCLVMGLALLMPLAVVLTSRLMAYLFSGGAHLLGFMAALNLRGFLGRNSVSAGALMVALSMLVSLTIMVGSFRRTVELWVEQTIRADLFAAPAARFLAGSGATIPGHYLGKARSLPGVLAVDGFRGLQMEWGDGIATFASRELEILEKHATLPFISGDYRKVLKEARERGEAVVSESFSLKHGVRAGDSLTLRTPKGPISLKVAGVFYDYSAQGGMILVDRSLFRRYWQDERVNNLAIYLEPGAEVEAVRERLQALFADESGVLVFTNRFLRERIMRVFDQAFRITYALEVIAFFVAALGVLNALTTNILERRRELAILRSLGFEARGLFRMIVHEAALLGALAGGVGLAGGVFLSLILIFVINVQSFGWSIQLGFPLLKLAEYLALALLVALISGYLPARSAGKVELARALREE